MNYIHYKSEDFHVNLISIYKSPPIMLIVEPKIIILI